MSTNPKIESSWSSVLNQEFDKQYFIDLKNFLADEKKTYAIYPPESFIYNAFNSTPIHQVKVVILGQDPYHGPEQAHGLSFSVPNGVKPPPSLVNIFKELHADLGIAIKPSGDLSAWAHQGVFLLNAILTVRANTPASHQKRGWEQFTDAVIQKISEIQTGVVFLLWGKFAQSKEPLIDSNKHFILKAAHPSPFSAHTGFLGCKHFSKTNELLKQQGKEAIDWS